MIGALCLLPASAAQAADSAQRPAATPLLDLDAAPVATLQPGGRFQISVPLRPSKAVNLGAARLDITLSASGKTKQTGPELHLIAMMPVAQTALSAGTASLILHGVVPEFAAERAGDYYPSDYSIHLGSGNVTNIGTPDDTLIDTERLTQKLQRLRIRLKASASH